MFVGTRQCGGLLVAIAVFGLTVVPVSACAVGGDWILFEERPTPIGLEVADVVFVHFTSDGDAFDRFLALNPWLDAVRPLVGAAQLHGSEGQVPVYALVTSCTHGFYGRSIPRHDGDFYLVGKWIVLPDGSRAFQAAGDLNDRWHY